MIARIRNQGGIARIVEVTRPLNPVHDWNHPQLRQARQQKGNPVQQTKKFVSHPRSDETNTNGEQELSKTNVHDKSDRHPKLVADLVALGQEQENDLMQHTQQERPGGGRFNAGVIHDDANDKGRDKATRQEERELPRQAILIVHRVLIGVRELPGESFGVPQQHDNKNRKV